MRSYSVLFTLALGAYLYFSRRDNANFKDLVKRKYFSGVELAKDLRIPDRKILARVRSLRGRSV